MLFRLNFLVLVLCVVMDRPYQFYYFVPLVTFWFVVIYGTMAMWPQILQKKANSRFLFVSLTCVIPLKKSPRLCKSIHTSKQLMSTAGLHLEKYFLLIGVLYLNRQRHMAPWDFGKVAWPPVVYLLLCLFTGG